MATISNTPAPKPIATTDASGDQPFMTPQRIRVLGIAGAAVLVVALVIWFVVTAGHRKEAYAESALEQARDAASQNNFGVAVQGFNKVITTFGGTPAAYKANFGIAETHLVAGQNELAITGLNDFLRTNPPPEYASTANSLLGTAYENLNKFPEAMAAYRKASDLASMDYLKARSLLDAGRAARLGNKIDDAKSIYNEIIAKYSKTGAMNEAQVRLAEITAGA